MLLFMLKQDDFTMTGETVLAHFYLRIRNRPYVLFALYELINPCDRAAGLLGFKTRSVFDRYHIISDEDLKEAAKKQQAYHEKKDQKAGSREAEG